MAQNLFRVAALGVLMGTCAVSFSLAQQTLQDVPTQVNESKVAGPNTLEIISAPFFSTIGLGE